MNALDNFYTDQSFVDWYKATQDEEHSSQFSKRIGVVWTWWLRIPFHTNILCKRQSLWMA